MFKGPKTSWQHDWENDAINYWWFQLLRVIASWWRTWFTRKWSLFVLTIDKKMVTNCDARKSRWSKWHKIDIRSGKFHAPSFFWLGPLVATFDPVSTVKVFDKAAQRGKRWESCCSFFLFSLHGCARLESPSFLQQCVGVFLTAWRSVPPLVDVLQLKLRAHPMMWKEVVFLFLTITHITKRPLWLSLLHSVV